MEPLSSSDLFRLWRGPWVHGSGTAAFGGAALDDLAAGIREVAAEVRLRSRPKAPLVPAALGAVYRLSDQAVVDALLELGVSCIAVDKGVAGKLPHHLSRYLDNASGVPHEAIGFGDVAPLDDDGRPPVVSPGFMPGAELAIGPLRWVGYIESGRQSLPLMHAKVLVAGAIALPDEYLEDWSLTEAHFRPMRVWLGSANWTRAARNHLEIGLWSKEPALVEKCYDFVLSVLKFSEPSDAPSPTPTRDLLDADWDDAGFAEYLADSGWYEREDDE